MSMTSFSVVSLMAMVPESECRMPTLMVDCAWAEPMAPPNVAATAAAARPAPRSQVRTDDIFDPLACL